MKKAVVFINIGNLEYPDLSLKANQKYYNHFGIEMRVITKHHSETINTSPCWIKSLVYEIYPDLDFVLVQDMDIIPVDLQYNIFDFLMDDQLNFATDETSIGKTPCLRNGKFFRWNAGLFAYPKRFKQLFREIFNYGLPDPDGEHLFDQYYINDFVKDEYINEIPYRFNTFFNPEIDYSKISFVHYTNYMGSHDKRPYIEKYHPKDMLE